jgi:hypothetical protein
MFLHDIYFASDSTAVVLFIKKSPIVGHLSRSSIKRLIDVRTEHVNFYCSYPMQGYPGKIMGAISCFERFLF